MHSQIQSSEIITRACTYVQAIQPATLLHLEQQRSTLFCSESPMSAPSPQINPVAEVHSPARAEPSALANRSSPTRPISTLIAAVQSDAKSKPTRGGFSTRQPLAGPVVCVCVDGWPRKPFNQGPTSIFLSLAVLGGRNERSSEAQVRASFRPDSHTPSAPAWPAKGNPTEVESMDVACVRVARGSSLGC